MKAHNAAFPVFDEADSLRIDGQATGPNVSIVFKIVIRSISYSTKNSKCSRKHPIMTEEHKWVQWKNDNEIYVTVKKYSQITLWPPNPCCLDF